MKSYSKYFEDITESELLEGLLAYGLFPEKIPDFLTGEYFYNYCKTLTTGRRFEDKEYDYVRYDTMRNTNAIRHLAFPNPFGYYNLCFFISNNRNELLNHFKIQTDTQEYKRSLIHIQKMSGTKCLFQMNKSYEDKDQHLESKIRKLSIKNRIKVEADISNCFPSIYSHSLAWALVGKSDAKKHKGDITLWYNKLDEYCRHIKNGETNGLLIGPHSSNLLSEIVLCNIDKQLSDKYDYYRNIDDFTCYVEDEAEAERFLLDLVKALKEYELSLNTKKTKISKMPITSDDDWVYGLNCFFIGEEKTDGGKLIFKKQKLRAFLDLSVSLAESTKNLAVYSYAIKMITGKYLGKQAKEYYLDFVHQIILLYPYIVHVVEKSVFEEFKVSTDYIKSVSIDLYEVGKKKQFYEPCIFALYWAIKHQFQLHDFDYVQDSIESGDCIFLLLSFIKAKQEKNKDGVKKLKEKAENIMNEDIEPYWLFIYEVLPNTKLTGDYKRIKKEKISFLKPYFKSIIDKK